MLRNGAPGRPGRRPPGDPGAESHALNVLVVGSGGREHALCRCLGASPLVDTLHCAPGNAGIGEIARRADVPATDVDGLVEFCRSEAVDHVVVGPERPLVDGLVDRLAEAGVTAFGPNAEAAAIEGSKGFAKDLCARYDIPTAAYGRFSEAAAAKAWIAANGAPIVVKADGLAAGKGVTVARSEAAAAAAVDEALGGRFGAAGREIVVEEFLDGEEASFFALADGETALPLASARDYKTAGEGDTGPNTGGMGAVSPAPAVTPEICDKIMKRIVEPTVSAMAAEGRPYTGVLYAGVMIVDGEPLLLEYNARFGDPECQALLARLNSESDLLPALMAATNGGLAYYPDIHIQKNDGTHASAALQWGHETAVTVVLAARGYPGGYETGSEIRSVEAAGELPGVTICHAATERRNGALVAAGGRVLNVTAVGADAAEARARAYEAVDAIDWPQGFCRRDVGLRAGGREA